MEQTLEILQYVINAGAGAMVLTAILGKIFPSEKVTGFAFSVGAGLSKWGIRTFNVATWNVIEKHIIATFNNLTAGFSAGLRSDNEDTNS